MFLMTHPRHGWHNAINTADRETMLKNGWTDAPKEEPPAPQSDPADPEAPTVESVRAQLDELGIPYHHKAGLEKLLALLP